MGYGTTRLKPSSAELLERLEENIPDDALVVQEHNAVVVAGAASIEKMTLDSEEDYEFSRDVIKRLIGESESMISEMKNLVEGCENPRAYEVFSNMIRDTIEATRRLTDLQKERRKLNLAQTKGSPTPAGNTIGTVNNHNVFVGTTSDLQKALNDPSILKQVRGHVIKDHE